MPLLTPDFPDIDPEEWERTPHLSRVQILATHWAEYGFGTPRIVHVQYVVKILLYVALGLTIASTTSGFGWFGSITQWWDEPIVWQKLLVWTVLWEMLGLGASSGPLAFRFSPPIGGVLYWMRHGTIRLAPWPTTVPFTRGATRTWLDVGLYAAILATLVALLASDGREVAGVPGSGLLLGPPLLLVFVGLLAVAGLRDRLLFLAARGEQYWVLAIMFATFPFVDMIVAAKIVMFAVWWGAAFSKLGRHFSFVVAAMMSNAPLFKPLALRRALYRRFPEDLRPSTFCVLLAHVGTVIEFGVPVVLLLSTNATVTGVALFVIVFFHLFILMNFPLAVPLEWNAFYMMSAFFLFWQFPAAEGFGLGDFSSTPALVAVFVAMFFFPVLGNLRPDLVSFLPAMRYYAGNWAVTQWAFRKGAEPMTGAENRLDTHVRKSAPNQVTQLTNLYGNFVAEVFLQKAVAWRSQHSQGRGLNTLMQRHLDDPDAYDIREGEFVQATLVGWQFGDAHLADERLIAEVQRQCRYEPGDVVVAIIESEPFLRGRVSYRVVDVAAGEIERGSIRVKDEIEQQGWLDRGAVSLQITRTSVAPRDDARA